MSISGGLACYNFPMEGGNQNGLGILAKHRGAEDVVGHVHLTSPQRLVGQVSGPRFVSFAKLTCSCVSSGFE